MGITLIDELPMEHLKGARVLVRINRSLDLPSAIPTLEFLIAAGTRIIVAAGAPGTAGDSLAEDLRRMLGVPSWKCQGSAPAKCCASPDPMKSCCYPTSDRTPKTHPTIPSSPGNSLRLRTFIAMTPPR